MPSSPPAPLVARDERAGYRAGTGPAEGPGQGDGAGQGGCHARGHTQGQPHGHDGATLEAQALAPQRGEDAGGLEGGRHPGGAGGLDGTRAHEGASGRDGNGPDAPPSLEAALAQVESALRALDDAELAAEANEAVRHGSVELHRQVNRLQARLVALVGELDQRQAHEADGAVTAGSWLRERVGCNPGEATQLVNASRRLRSLPRLAASFADGRVSWAHATAITQAAIPQRAAAIRALEDPLVELAQQARPREVRKAVARIRDVADDDGSQTPPLPDAGPDPRRSLTISRTVDGLAEIKGSLDPVTAEWLETLLPAFESGDGPDTPDEQRRTAAQLRHDALHELLTKVAAHPETPTLQGAQPRASVMVDVATLAGAHQEATFTPRLRFGGEVTPELARQMVHDAKITAVKTMGPWRPVSVGRTQRTLPPWLRELMHLLHQRCRGPDCDRPAVRAEAHHLDAWAQGGESDLNRTIPLCSKHHDLVTNGGWRVEMDPDTGVCTWTSPTGRVVRTEPPS